MTQWEIGGSTLIALHKLVIKKDCVHVLSASHWWEVSQGAKVRNLSWENSRFKLEFDPSEGSLQVLPESTAWNHLAHEGEHKVFSSPVE